jgi:hypothetical protein
MYARTSLSPEGELARPHDPNDMRMPAGYPGETRDYGAPNLPANDYL